MIMCSLPLYKNDYSPAYYLTLSVRGPTLESDANGHRTEQIKNV